MWEPALEPNGARGAWDPSVAVRLFGPFTVVRNGSVAALPASRKVRALIAYLVMAPRPVHRARLCEMFWDVPNDPRGELRWCLSKIRGLVGDPSHERVKAENDLVSIDTSTIEVDALCVAARAEGAISGGDLDLLKQLAAKFEGEFLEGFEADRIPLFEAWLIGERQRFQDLHADILSRIMALLPKGGEALPYIRQRLDLLPYDVAVHRDLLATLAACGRIAEGEAHLEAATHLFRSEGLSSAPLDKAWREQRQMAARGTRPELPPCPLLHRLRRKPSWAIRRSRHFTPNRRRPGRHTSHVAPPPFARLSTRLAVGRNIAWLRAAGLLLFVVASGGAWYVADGLKSAATVAQSAALPTLAEPPKRLPRIPPAGPGTGCRLSQAVTAMRRIASRLVAVLRRQPHDDREVAVAAFLVEIAGGLAADRRLRHGVDVARRQAVARGAAPVDADLDGRLAERGAAPRDR